MGDKKKGSHHPFLNQAKNDIVRTIRFSPLVYLSYLLFFTAIRAYSDGLKYELFKQDLLNSVPLTMIAALVLALLWVLPKTISGVINVNLVRRIPVERRYDFRWLFPLIVIALLLLAIVILMEMSVNPSAQFALLLLSALFAVSISLHLTEDFLTAYEVSVVCFSRFSESLERWLSQEEDLQRDALEGFRKGLEAYNRYLPSRVELREVDY